jgi:flagellar hook-length control protein FliK
VSSLEKAIMASGRSLDSYTTNDESLSEFGSMLVKMGFDSAEVDEMVSALKNRLTTGKVTLADLFKGASQLTEPETDPAAMLDVSAMSDLEEILGALGLDTETSQRLLSDALMDDGQAIDLEALAAGIRQVLAQVGDGSETTAVDADGILERLERIGLLEDSDGAIQATIDELISEVSRFNDLQDVLDDTDGADGLPGSLLISYLQQLISSLGEEGQELRNLIASAGEESGGFDGASLLSKLVQMKQDIAGAPDSQLSEKTTGRMSLERFAALLESRVAEGIPETRVTTVAGAGGGAKGLPAAGSMTESIGGFLGNVTTAAENSTQNSVLPVDPENDATLKAEWQPDSDRYSDKGRFGKAAGSASETVGRQSGSPSSVSDASRQAAMSSDADSQFSQNSSEKQAMDRFSDILNSAGREKLDSASNESGIGADSFIRDLKAGGESVAMARSDTGRNLPNYLLNQVSRQIVQMKNAGDNDITLQLKPPHLGRMKLNIEHVSGGGMRVGIVVESAAARDMLLAHSNELKASLADQGLRLDRIDVEAQADFGQSMSHADKGFERFGNGKRRWAGTPGGDVDIGSAEAAVEFGAMSSVSESGRLDLVA